MSRPSSVRTDTPTIAPADEVLFKRDRPRHIDRYINFFGSEDAAAQSDPCGEAFLTTLDGPARDDARDDE